MASKAVVDANQAKRDGEYFCWACGNKVIFKRGRVIRSHFAHLTDENCKDGWTHKGKTDWHREMQDAFEVKEKLMEDAKTGERHIADAVADGVVFEFQHSFIPPEEVLERTRFYYRQGYRIVWVYDATDKFSKGSIHKLECGENEETIYNWSRATTMFNMLPFQKHDSIMRVVLYWEEKERYETSNQFPYLKYKNVGYFNLITWSHTKDEYEVEYRDTPDLRYFVIGARRPVEKGMDTNWLFDNYPVDKKRYEYIVDSDIEAKEERSQEFRYR